MSDDYRARHINFRMELEDLINTHSMETMSGTPDFILSEYLMSCLDTFERITNRRQEWYGRYEDASIVPLTTRPDLSDDTREKLRNILDDAMSISSGTATPETSDKPYPIHEERRVLIALLTDPENQPHQYVNQENLLLRDLDALEKAAYDRGVSDGTHLEDIRVNRQ